jgi:predicted nucleotidyltransferase
MIVESEEEKWKMMMMKRERKRDTMVAAGSFWDEPSERGLVRSDGMQKKAC